LDVFPTILGYLKIEKPKAFEGVNLLPALLGEDVGSFPYVISEDGNLSVRTGHWKLIHSENNALSETYALFNLKNDPGEKVDLASVEKRKFAVLKEKMDEYRKNFPETSVLPPELNEEARAALRALGYLQ
jgi:arylsulfatase A-like enzyme